VLVTEATFAVKVALVAVAGMDTLPGTVTAPLLLDRPTLIPPVGAEPDKLTVHESAIDPVMVVLLQLTALMVGATDVPLPLKLIVAVGALLEIVSRPDAEIDDAGSNWTVSTDACPGFRVTGKLPPATEKPVPDAVAAVIVTAAVPFDVTVTDFVIAVPTETLPNEREVALKPSVAVAASSCRAIALELLPVDAVRVADCVFVTEATIAVNDVLVAPAGITTELGTETAALLVARTTLTPPAGAEPDNVTVHLSASDPAIVVVLQVIALTVGTVVAPVPLRLITGVGALLAIVSCPITELAEVGSN
jgi:hypothetical protein